MSKESDFYKNLKLKLEETTTFPSEYMYKFIVPTSDEKFTAIENIFNNLGAVINSKSSKNGKYTSLTIMVKMNSADDIISKYKKVAKIEGVVSL